MKITEALCNVITEAGGTPSHDDAESVTHALGTLYTTLGGTDELPNDVADRINSLSDHIGGGGSEPTIYLAKAIIHNTTAASGTFNACSVRRRNEGEYSIESKSLALKANTDLEVDIVCNSAYYDVEDWQHAVAYAGRLSLKKSDVADPTKVVATISRGNCALVRNPSRDSSTMYGYLLDMNCSVGEEEVIITISITA